MLLPRITAVFALAVLLCGCASFDRADQAAAAKKQMVGMSREDILACMGPAKKKAKEGDTEVWSYLSTNGRSDSASDTLSITGYAHNNGAREKSFCTINIVLKQGIVKTVNYNGPTSSGLFTKDDECGFAVANCVPLQTDR